LGDRLSESALDPRAFQVVSCDIGMLDVAVAAHDLGRFGQRHQQRPILLFRHSEMTKNRRQIFARQRPLHPALRSISERIERGATQEFEANQDRERSENPAAEFMFAQMSLNLSRRASKGGAKLTLTPDSPSN
jgi:hypothetical protein